MPCIIKEDLQQLFKFFLQLKTHFARLLAIRREGEANEHLRTDVAPAPLQVFSTWTITGRWQPPPLGAYFLDYSAWGHGGPLFAIWFQMDEFVEWPQSPDISTGDPGVSWMELALSFVAWSQVVVPLKRMRPRSKDEYLQTFSSWSQVELHKVGLGELPNTFSILISQIRRLHGYDPWPARSHGFVKSVFLLGSRVQSYG